MMISPKSSFTHDDYRVLDCKLIHEGSFRYLRYQVEHRLFNGEWTPPLQREIMERYSAAGILLYDPILDKVVLINQFRPGAMTTATMNNPPHPKQASAWLTEIVAGVIDNNAEKPDQVAKREANEEAGCEVLELYPITEYFVSPGGSNEYLYLYCGRIDASQIGGVHGLTEEHEDIFAFSLPADEAFELIRQGQIRTAPAILSLTWLQLHRNFLRDLWLKKS